jgi:hypothetical protein
MFDVLRKRTYFMSFRGFREEDKENLAARDCKGRHWRGLRAAIMVSCMVSLLSLSSALAVILCRLPAILSVLIRLCALIKGCSTCEHTCLRACVSKRSTKDSKGMRRGRLWASARV